MGTMNLNFKKYEVTGATKAEALAKVADHFALNADGNVKGDATQAWKAAKKAAKDGWTSTAEKQFMAEYLLKKKAIAGEAYVITVEAAVESTRERPWTINDVKNEQGKRVESKVFRLIDDDTNTVLKTISSERVDHVTKVEVTKDADGKIISRKEVKVPVVDKDGNPSTKIVRPTKAMAKEAAKQLIAQGYKGHGHCEVAKEVLEGESVAFTFEYTPSKSAKTGTYLVFGIEKD